MAEGSLNPGAWEGKCVHDESTLHQLSPFLGKMKSTMARELLLGYSDPDDVVLDPFCGSGTVPLEAAITGRNAIGIDRNPYSITLTKGKLYPPKSEDEAITRAEKYLDKIGSLSESASISPPEWVTEFFHPKTLSGISQLFPLLIENDEDFLTACLLGILHHQRPGFLSYPASHLKPYLRDEKFPREEYPEKYEYREIRPRLISKIERAYRRFPDFDSDISRRVESGNSPDIMQDKILENSVDAIITSPPYMNKLDYGRDNRLRLFFLGVDDLETLDGSPETESDYREFLHEFMKGAVSVLKPEGRLVFVLGESRRSGSAINTAEVLTDVIDEQLYDVEVSEIIQDQVPTREINSMSSETETILALRRGKA